MADWPFRKQPGQGLVARMLCVDVDKRITIAEIEARRTLHDCDAAWAPCTIAYMHGFIIKELAMHY